MPVHVDVEKRLADIAEATIAIASKEGADAVTIRSVAKRLGGSTGLVTRYVPTRAALLTNAGAWVQAQWNDDYEKVLNGAEGVQRLRALAALMCSTSDLDQAARRMWVEQVQHAGPRVIDTVVEAGQEMEVIRRAASGTKMEGAAWLHDLLFLAFRGYFILDIEDPDGWPAERAATAVDTLLRVLDEELPGGCDGLARPAPAGQRP